VYNINGQEIDNYYLGESLGTQLKIITDAWSARMYILKMQGGNDFYAEKLIEITA
jgi:hypothetical protein